MFEAVAFSGHNPHVLRFGHGPLGLTEELIKPCVEQHLVAAVDEAIGLGVDVEGQISLTSAGVVEVEPTECDDLKSKILSHLDGVDDILYTARFSLT